MTGSRFGRTAPRGPAGDGHSARPARTNRGRAAVAGTLWPGNSANSGPRSSPSRPFASARRPIGGRSTRRWPGSASSIGWCFPAPTASATSSIGRAEKGTQLFSAGSGRSPLPKLAAIGPGTADELVRYGLRADLMPDQFRAEALADALVGEAPGATIPAGPGQPRPRGFGRTTSRPPAPRSSRLSSIPAPTWSGPIRRWWRCSGQAGSTGSR